LQILEKSIELSEEFLESSKQNLNAIKSTSTFKIDDIETKKQISKISINEIEANITALK